MTRQQAEDLATELDAASELTRRLAAEFSARELSEPRPDWIGRLYAWALEPPVRLRAKAPRPFVPPPGVRSPDALPAFLAEQDRLLVLVAQSAGLDLGARKVPSPVTRYVRYNVYSAFRILTAHQRRHLWEARRAATAVREGLSG